MKKSIVWLASYPKSGNTWTRIFLANYLTNAQQPVPINEVHRFGMGDSISKTYRMVAGGKVDLKNIPLSLSLRGKVLRGIVNNNADVNLVKTHNRRTVAMGVTLIPEALTRSAIYIIRNPLDMALSYARHYGLSNQDAIDAIVHKDNANRPDDKTVAQFLGAWSDHVQSWTSFSPYPVLVIRYEDLLENPEEHFAKVVKHIGMPLDQERLERAVKFSSFRELKKQESEKGFAERSTSNATFFSRGTSGQWKSELTDEQIHKVRKTQRNMMKRYGYYDQ